MATYYPTSSSNHQRDVFQNSYISSDSYQESPCPPVDMMYQNQTSNDTSFLELLSGNMQPNSQILSRVEDHDEHNLNYQELSLSLGMQLPSSSMDLPAFQYNYLNSHLQNSSDHGSQTHKVENTEYLSFNLVGTPKNGTMNNGQCSISDAYDGSYGVVGRIIDSKYLKPSQELLDEIANLREALSQLKMNRLSNLHKLRVDGANEKGSKSIHQSGTVESATSSSGELSASDKQDLQNKLTKLFSLLDEVDRKYREYCQQLQSVEAGLDMVSGCGAARPYTALAHQTISRHFRCLRDAINDQIQVTRKSLGDQDDSSDRVLPRLRNVEKQLRQQRSFHQLGGTRHTWRPQRGLPEGSVSILRAWLFEHFLNPYPKDSEKIMLAKQTGLTRGQIANWFINARVRLWKPMIEDMYKEEFGDEEGNYVSSQEHAVKASVHNSSSSEDKDKVLGPVDGHIGQSSDSNPEFFNQMEVSRFGEPQLLSDYVV
uniref:BEL1-like homeodomain protein 3 n=1 Tax=Erigeron canadensis TaxID=72917 RepID=UPI001CB934B6|nr:BEL1-like homeodomain protein 3 [Erigeron canadensis]XP_043617938.1 BEL1-like homeodomain protein 3 [Erigeron canadensis]